MVYFSSAATSPPLFQTSFFKFKHNYITLVITPTITDVYNFPCPDMVYFTVHIYNCSEITSTPKSSGDIKYIVWYTLIIERFSIEYRKTKTKVITLANHKEHRQNSEQIKTRSNYR